MMKVSQLNIAQSITLHWPACLPPTQQTTHTQPSTWCTSDSSDEADLLPLCWGPVPMLACPLLALWAVDRSQDGQPDWSASIQPHSQQTVMHCVFYICFSRCWIRPYGKAFVPCVHQWALAAHVPVSGSPHFLPWTTFDRCWPLQARNTPQEWQHWRYSDFVIEPAQFSLSQTLSNPYIYQFFLLLKTKCSLLKCTH